MDKKGLEKNVLDLRFNLQSQLMNVSLIMLTGGLLAFLGTFVWYKERIFFGIAISVIITLISLITYFSSKRNIEGIFKEIRNLNSSSYLQHN